MFARVIPLLRTPPGADQFDYKIPDRMTLAAGDAVVVPFRGRGTVAVVGETLLDSPHASKALMVTGAYDRVHFPKSLLELVAWQAKRSFASRSAVLKAWLRSFPKRPGHGPPDEPPRSTLKLGSAREVWSVDARTELVRAARLALDEGERVLILTPWKIRVEELVRQLPGARGLSGDLSDGQAFYAWQSFLAGSTHCLVSTRLGAWLGCVADRILIDEPENDDHKQDELAPRYDARLIASWCAAHAGARVETYGLTPPLIAHRSASDAQRLTINVPLSVHIRHPQGRSAIPMLQADTLAQLRAHEGPRILIHPIRGVAARLVCRDCGWRAACPACGFGLSAETDRVRCRHCGKQFAVPSPALSFRGAAATRNLLSERPTGRPLTPSDSVRGDMDMETCPACGGTDLGKSWPGIETLKRAWEKNEPYLAVEWRDLSNEKLEAPFPPGALIALSDGSLLGGMSEDVRRAERRCLAFRRLAGRVALTKDAALIVQTEEAQAASWTDWLTQAGMEKFYERERKQREVFGYPPAVRLVKVLVDGDEATAERWRENLTTITGPCVTALPRYSFRGPFPVPFRRASRAARSVFHLLYPRETDEAAIINQLSPLAGSAIMDLDPIAFFM